MSNDKLAALCALLLAGCAATPKGDPANDSQVASAKPPQSAGEKVCTREKPLGSNLPRVVCYTRHNSLAPALQRHETKSTLRGPRAQLPGFRDRGG